MWSDAALTAEHHLVRSAHGLGYTDSGNFIRAFKRSTGISPNRFRRRAAG